VHAAPLAERQEEVVGQGVKSAGQCGCHTAELGPLRPAPHRRNRPFAPQDGPLRTRARSWRRVTPSLRYAFCRWLSTVRTERTSRAAIWRLLAPPAASSAISRSRGVRSTAFDAT